MPLTIAEIRAKMEEVHRQERAVMVVEEAPKCKPEQAPPLPLPQMDQTDPLLVIAKATKQTAEDVHQIRDLLAVTIVLWAVVGFIMLCIGVGL